MVHIITMISGEILSELRMARSQVGQRPRTQCVFLKTFSARTRSIYVFIGLLSVWPSFPTRWRFAQFRNFAPFSPDVSLPHGRNSENIRMNKIKWISPPMGLTGHRTQTMHKVPYPEEWKSKCLEDKWIRIIALFKFLYTKWKKRIAGSLDF